MGVPTRSSYVYPDVSVVCGRPILEDATQDVLLNPSLVAEVLSPATRAYDLGRKLDLYRAHSTLAAIVLVETPRRLVFVHERAPGTDRWALIAFADPALTIDTLGLTVPLDDVYAGVTFDASAT